MMSFFGGEDLEKIEKARHRPRPYELRQFEPMVARIEFRDGGYCEVFSNGYAIYDNGNRKCVVWVPDCGSHFPSPEQALMDKIDAEERRKAVRDGVG